MFTLNKRRRENLAKDKPDYVKDTDPLRLKAAGRLDRIKEAESAGPAIETGPFAQKKAVGVAIAIGVPKGGGREALAEEPPKPSGGDTPFTAEDHGQAAKHHRSLSDLYGKYTKPGTDTIPHTEGLNPAEKKELGPEIDMERP